MTGRFVIWVEDSAGNVVRAFTWVGRAAEGIAKAKAEAKQFGAKPFDVWATPTNEVNNNWSI